MSSTRTQIYLTKEQRKKLDARAAREDKALAQLIREAVDAYLDGATGDVEGALASTFGACPGIEAVPRAEWDRHHG
jgi:hypothetical protein